MRPSSRTRRAASPNVHFDVFDEVCVRGLHQQRRPHDPRRSNDNVNPTELGLGLLEQGLHLRGVGHIGADRHRPAAAVLDGPDQLLRRLGRCGIGDRHCDAVTGQPHGDGAPDATRPARDNRNLRPGHVAVPPFLISALAAFSSTLPGCRAASEATSVLVTSTPG